MGTEGDIELEDLNDLLQQSNEYVRQHVEGVPGVHVLDGYRWTEDCQGFDDDKHHSKAALDHVLIFLSHLCPGVQHLVQKHCPQLCPYVNVIH
jgi:iron only hydrogenase large subunit-like protein